MKYIIVEKNLCEVPIIFPDCLEHSTFANMKPISAGKCSIGYDMNHHDMDYDAWGKSKSLNLGSRPQDSNIIKHAFEFET